MDDTAITWRDYQRSRDEVAYQTRLSILSLLEGLLAAPESQGRSEDFCAGISAAIDSVKLNLT